MGSLGSIVPFILMFAVFYFLLIRPQQRKSRQRKDLLGAIKKGDKIVTIGGMHGTIVELNDDTVVLRVNDATKLTYDRSAINTVISSSTAVNTTTSSATVKDEKAEEIQG